MEAVFIDENGDRRLRDTEYVLPIVVGTSAWWLGKKASEYLSHNWTVYLRGAHNEDLSHIIQKVTFELHHTFQNPHRAIEQQPYEVKESGWGEFEINITVTFQPDAREKDVTVVHKLKLYESDNTPNTTKKPVVSETYEELVFSEPTEAFYNRVMMSAPRPAPELSCLQWVLSTDDTEEATKLQECRARIAAMVADLKKDFATVA